MLSFDGGCSIACPSQVTDSPSPIVTYLHLYLFPPALRSPYSLSYSPFLISPISIKHLAPLSPRHPAVTPPPPPHTTCHRYKLRESANHSSHSTTKGGEYLRSERFSLLSSQQKALQRRVSTNGTRSSKDLDAIQLQIHDQDTIESSHNFTTPLINL